MGDEKDVKASPDLEPAPSVPPLPVTVLPRPVTVVPRPGTTPTSRMPPPPSSRGVGRGLGQVGSEAPGPGRLGPPPPPLRARPAAPLDTTPPAQGVEAAPSSPSLAARPSVVPRPAPTPTPPAPPARNSPPPHAPRVATHPPSLSASAQLEQRLGAAQLELRKLGSERHALRARLRRETNRVQELESALRAEKELRRQAVDEHQVALNGVRSRMRDADVEYRVDVARLESEVARLVAELEGVRAELSKAVTLVPASGKMVKAPQGLRRIRGIGPGYERLLEQAGITRVEQVATWTDRDLVTYAEALRIKPERIAKEDWVGQARRLAAELE